jgi:hypothetical protein
MASNKRGLQAYVRYDGTGRIIPGSLILNRFKPAVGNWQETPAYECCNYTPTTILVSIPICPGSSCSACSRPTPIVYISADCFGFLTVGCEVWNDAEGNIPSVLSAFLYEGNVYSLEEGVIIGVSSCA